MFVAVAILKENGIRSHNLSLSIYIACTYLISCGIWRVRILTTLCSVLPLLWHHTKISTLVLAACGNLNVRIETVICRVQAATTFSLWCEHKYLTMLALFFFVLFEECDINEFLVYCIACFESLKASFQICVLYCNSIYQQFGLYLSPVVFGTFLPFENESYVWKWGETSIRCVMLTCGTKLKEYFTNMCLLTLLPWITLAW